MVSVKTTPASQPERIWQALGEVGDRFTAEDEMEREWMAQRCAPELTPVVTALSLQALHLLDAVAEAGTIKVVELARVTGVPKGTVSKALQRLVRDGVVRREQTPDNRKEVLISLTDDGTQIQRAHQAMHEEMERGMLAFFERYSAAEQEVILRVLEDLALMPRDGPGFRPDLLPSPADEAGR